MKRTKIQPESIHKIEEYIQNNPQIIKFGQPIYSITLDHMGSGESNLSLLLKINNNIEGVVRIALLYDHLIQPEFETLKKIPQGIAPEPFCLDTSKSIIPHPFLIESYISGQPVANWDEKSLCSLAATLAELHNKTKTNQKVAIQFQKKLLEDNNSFLKTITDLNVKKFVQIVIDFLNTKQNLFDTLVGTSILHGDLNGGNILVDNEGKIKLIDWELSHENDPAREFSTFYYDDMEYFNWRIQLQTNLQDIFLNKYIDLTKVDDKNFKKRIKIWQIVDQTGAFIYCTWKGMMDQEHQEKFDTIAQHLKTSIEKYINNTE